MQRSTALPGRAGWFLVMIAALAATPVLADSEETILYHEPLRLMQPLGDAASRLQELSFNALGQRFELQLRPNDRLQRQVRRRNFTLLLGKVAGRPKSWVRLTRHGSSLSGMFSDGQQLYLIEPWAEIAAGSVTGGDNDGELNAIYRLADVLLPAGAAGCGLQTLAAAVPGDVAFADLIDEMSELPAFQAQGANRKIELQAVADYEFFQQYGADSEAQVLSRLNIVDGIFSDQLDIEIAVTQVDVFDTPGDPFTSNDPEGLLGEVANYRAASATGDGLTHLFTWRNLDGSTRGIAYLASACLAQYGAALSQQFLSSLSTGALIAAHEIGHNFGALHDGEPSDIPGLPNPCESVPQTYLMAPIIGSSSTFSQCSLNTMSTFLSGPQASCVVSIGVRLENIQSPLTVQVDTPRAMNFSVHNAGGGLATGVELQLNFPPDLDLVPQNVGCNVAAGSATCPLGDLADGAQVPVAFTVQSATVGSYSVTVTLATDADPSADQEQITVNVQLSAPAAQGGGGGGGLLGADGLLALLWLARMVSRRRRP